jgi:hypothetical protein
MDPAARLVHIRANGGHLPHQKFHFLKDVQVINGMKQAFVNCISLLQMPFQ